MLPGYRGSALPTENERSVYNLDVAYKIACEQLAKVDIEEQCRRSDAQYQVKDSQKTITVQYLNRSYLITVPDIDVSLADSVENVPLREKILIMHYFIQAKGTATTNKLIAFRELPGGNVYHPTFVKRTMKPLTDNFGREPGLLVSTSKRLGGHKTDFGDTAVTINAFSRVPITLVLWQGDDELPPQLNLLFDSTISDYLETEDVTVLCETLTWRLIGYLREA
jgi:hypothetical protein